MRRRDAMLGIGCAVGCAVLSPSLALASSGIAAALSAIGNARFVAIGERHDNPSHHGVQAALVSALKPAGIAFEMIPHEQEDLVNRLRREGASRDDLASALGWADSGWPSFALYAAIMEAAPDAYIAGGGLSRADLSAVYSNGARGLGEEISARYGLNEPLPPEVEAVMIDEQFEAHCGLLDRAKLAPMVAVQRAWDAAYAEAWRRSSLRGGGGRAVLICGNLHARLVGAAPAYLSRAMPDASIASIGQLEEGDDAAPAGYYTATIRSPRPRRDDPCERMREMVSPPE